MFVSKNRKKSDKTQYENGIFFNVFVSFCNLFNISERQCTFFGSIGTNSSLGSKNSALKQTSVIIRFVLGALILLISLPTYNSILSPWLNMTHVSL